MLKFLKKFRKDLLTKSSLKNYALYAIGEIILLVVGILIALSINNAAEEAKDRTKEKVYLQGLYQELKKDSIFFENMEKTLSSIEKAVRYVVTCLENPSIINSDSLLFLNSMRKMIASNQTMPEPIVWKELISSGNLRLIKNRELIEMLYSHYHLVSSCQSDYESNAHQFILQGRYFDSRTFSIADQDDYFDNWKKDVLPSDKVFDKIVESEEFYSISKGIVTGIIISKKVLSGLKRNVKEPLKAIRNELVSD